ncbi:MAG TPA: AMP-binding protein, partial [Gemmatimonadales bacterium]|nr:AMP-binding protein [Gemmatimonadales bacterium]
NARPATARFPMTSSYASGASTTPLLGVTIGRQLELTTGRNPSALALVSRHQGIRLTYGELWERVEACARAFLDLGVAKGDRVGIWAGNCAEWLIVQYATARIGAILVNVNPAYRRHELRYALGKSGVSVLVAARAFRTTDYVSMLEEVRAELPQLRSVVLLGEGAERMTAWLDFLARASHRTAEEVRQREATLDFDEAINIQYTSGTTGAPKGATLSHHNILNNGYFVGMGCGYSAADRICVPVPLYHCFGMVMGNLAALTHGASVIYPEVAFDPRATLEAVAGERCTSLYGVPTMFIAQLQHPEFQGFDLTSLRTGIMAGSPCPVEVMKQVIERMHARDLTICYGMTETSPVSFQSLADDDLEHRTATVGAVHPHVECKVVDPETGRTVGRSQPGELCTRGYSVMLGYWDDDAATRASIDPARWMHTGDLAVMRDDGYVNIIGRIKDMVIRGGENIYPREVEEFLYTHPAIADVQVIGVPDVKYGEELCAWVRCKEGKTATEEEIRAYCRGQIASFKIPRYFRFCDGFPLTVTGKVRKVEMREISVRELGLESAAAVVTA